MRNHLISPASVRRRRIVTLLSILIFASVSLVGLGVLLSGTDTATAGPNDLSVEVLAGYNLVVDSNVLAPSTYAPSVATVAGRFCNVSGNTLTDVQAYIGDFTNGTPGIYPVRNVSDPGFAAQHPHLVPDGGSYSFVHVGGQIGTADATRFIGTLLPGECRVQYWHFSYPRRSNPNNTGSQPAWGLTNVVTDDLWLNFDIWGTANDGTGTISDNQSWTMTMRNEISAMANKIQPNPNGIWFNTNSNIVLPGEVITSNGILYELGNIRQGFDNDGDFVPDYNAWMQPIGDPAYDPSCFRLIRVTGVLTVSRGSGKPDLIIPFSDQLYFTNLPPDNTGVLGDVRYTFMALNGPCVTAMTPYQEVASGFDNEKFNSDFGAGIPPLLSSGPHVTINKSGNPNIVALGSNISYQVPFQNSGTAGAGLPLSTGGTPLVISDTIPPGTVYVAGSATADVGVVIRYSTDNGATWSITEPVPASAVTTIQWWLTDTLAAGAGGNASFQVTVPTSYAGSSVIENCADVSFGAGTPFDQACDYTLVQGSNSIGDTVWRDDNSSGGQDSGEPGIANVSVSLYFDRGTIGVLDSADLLVLTTTTSGAGLYTFGSLPNGNYLVLVDSFDSDIPFGYGNTTPELHVVTGLGQAGPENYIQADFGFGPVLILDKQLISSDPAYEGQNVVYTIDLVNTRPGNGTGQAVACQFPVWATIDHPTNANTPPGGTAANARWQNTGNGLGSPNGLYATTIMENNTDLLGLSGFNQANQGGNIVSVEVIAYLQEIRELKTTDQFLLRVWLTDTQRSEYAFTGSGYFTRPVGSFYTIRQNVTAAHPNGPTGWRWANFSNNIAELQVVGSKGSGGGTSGDIGLDAIAYIITTDKQCGGPADTIDPLPMTDTYDAAKLQFLSAVPSASSNSTGGSSPYANTGVITWTNLGPLYAGQTKVVTLTFRALQPPGNSPTTITNTARVTNARFLNGRPIHEASDFVTTTLQPTGSIGDRVWSDSNGNGVQDPSEGGIPGVVITLTSNVTITVGSTVYPPGSAVTTTTSITGSYLFAGLLDGTYTVTVDINTVPGSSPIQTFDNDGLGTPHRSVTTISGGNDQLNEDFGYTIPNTIFGNVWKDNDLDGNKDAGENGFSGVTVELYRLVGATYVLSTTTTTNANGDYIFTDLANGTYTVTVRANTLPPGTWIQSFDPDDTCVPTAGPGCDDTSLPIIASGGNIYGPYDFGYGGNSEIGDTVYADWDGDGFQDSGDAGIDGVTVYLYEDNNGNGVIDAGDAFIAATTTAGGGQYLFTGVPSGTYIVVVDRTTLPTGFSTQTYDPDEGPPVNGGPACSVCDGNGSASVDGTPAGSDYDVDFGYRPSGIGSIGDLVWRDEDGDGSSGVPTAQEPGEGGIPSITVELWADINGTGSYTRALTTVTSVTGTYSFGNLPAGQYRVIVDVNDPQLPVDAIGFPYVPSTPVSVDVTLTSGQAYRSADFGFTGTGMIGDTIFWDANRSGAEDFNESGIPGVDVTLTNVSAVTIGGVSYGPGAYVVTQTTNGSGQYLFGGLAPATYTVSVDTSTLPVAAVLLSDPDANGVPCTSPSAFGCDNQTTVRLTTIGQVFLGADFGYDPPGVIGDFVWRDLDGDGVQESGEPGLPGLVITLTNGVSTFTTTTDINGFYSFNNVADGTWTVTFQQPVNMAPTAVIPAQIISGTGSVGTSTTVVVSGGSVTSIGGNACSNCSLHVDSGFVLSGLYSISGHVFFDVDNLGGSYITGTDTPYANIVVYLYNSSGQLIGSTTTDAANGYYIFGNLPDGNYTVAVNTASPQLSGMTLNVEPDVLPVPGICGTCNNNATVTVSGADVNDQDFGFYAAMDFGDLPAAYIMTLLSDGGPYHVVTGTLRLGSGVSTEADGKVSGNASADTLDDGVTRNLTDFWTPGATVSLFITTTGGAGRVAGWLDFNNDGDFNDPSEFIDFGNLTGANTVSVSIPGTYATGTTVNARFRIFDPASIPGGTLDVGDAVGPAVAGEVEDYQWAFGPTAVSLLNAGVQETPAAVSALLLVLLAGLLTGILRLRLAKNGRVQRVP